MVRVERELCGEGTLAAGVGVRVNGLELRIPEEKARQKDYEGLVSPQEEASLVKETSDVTKSGMSEFVRLNGKKFFGGGRGLEGGQGGQISKWVEPVSRGPLGGPTSTRNPVSIGPSFHLRKWGWASLIRWGVGLFLLGPIEKKVLKRGWRKLLSWGSIFLSLGSSSRRS